MPGNPVKETVEALYKPIESMVKTLAGPAAEEIGLSFRDSVRVWRIRRQARLFERVQDICAESGIEPKAVKLSFLFDIVGNASMEDDDDLQDLWANLLANAADPRRESLVSSAFPEVLKQLSKAEATFLYLLDKATSSETFPLPRPYSSSITDVQGDNLRRLGLTDGTHGTCHLTTFGRAFIRACQAPEKSSPQGKKF